MLRALAGRLTERGTSGSGQPYDQSFPEAMAAPVTIVTPKGQAVDQPETTGREPVALSNTPCSGREFARVRIGQLGLESSFAANTDPAESDLTRLDEAVLGELLPGWEFYDVHTSDWRDLTRDAASGQCCGVAR